MNLKYPYKILVVEDEDIIRENFILYLKMEYENVLEARDGEEAFKIYKQNSPDIMIVDINIPKINGLELIKEIRKEDLSTKIIVLTAHTETEFLIEAVGLKLTQYLFKPVNRKELKKALDKAIVEMKEFTISFKNLIYLEDGYTYNFDLKELKNSTNIVDMTYKEQLLLEYLLKNRNRLCAYEEILISTYPDDGTLDSLKNIVKRLRKKLPKNTILNLSSQGYRINN